MMRTHVLFSLLPCLFLAGCDLEELANSERYQSDFHYSYALAPGGRLEVEGFNGSIEISGWDQNQCDISGVKSASTTDMRDRIKVDVSQGQNAIYIRSVRPAMSDWHSNVGVRFLIHVPRKVELSRIVTSNGSIHVEGTAGPADLKTSNSSIRAVSVDGRVAARTSNGSITMDGVSGNLDLHTSNSAIRAEHVMSSISATTSNGSITAHFDEKALPSESPLKFETSNSSVDVTMNRSPRSDIRASTCNGSITLRLPADSSAKVSASTSNGSVHSDFQVDTADTEKHRRHQSLEETLGSGGPLIDLHTSNSSIRLLKI
jgi:DUF4097 and DUF4098 domain-containing protein YvlB